MPSSASKSILIVEDDYSIRYILAQFLKIEGYDVLSAENGAVALDLLKTVSPPNLILLDMKMPVMNGWEFAAEYLRQHGRTSPIVVMTAAADAAKRAEDIKAEGVVAKPFELDEMLSIINQHKK